LDIQCAVQTSFSFRHDRETRLDFEGGEITADAGLIARRTLRVLNEFDRRIGFTESLVACLRDDRHQSYVLHEHMQLIIQRLYGIVAGYEDQNDADKLRYRNAQSLLARHYRNSHLLCAALIG